MARALRETEDSLKRIEQALAIPVEGDSNLTSWLLFISAMVLVGGCGIAWYLALGRTDRSVTKLERRIDDIPVELEKIWRQLADVARCLEVQEERLDSLSRSVEQGFRKVRLTGGQSGSAVGRQGGESIQARSEQNSATPKRQRVVEIGASGLGDGGYGACRAAAKAQLEDVASLTDRLCKDFNRLLTSGSSQTILLHFFCQ